MAGQISQMVRRNDEHNPPVVIQNLGDFHDGRGAIELEFPSGRRLNQGQPGNRFLGSKLNAISKEHGILTSQQLTDLLQKVLNISVGVFPSIRLDDPRQTLLSSMREILSRNQPSPLVPGRHSQYQKIAEQKIEPWETVLTVQAIRQQVIPSWLNAPFPCGDMNPIPDSLYSASGSEKLAEALSWDVPLFAQLDLPDRTAEARGPIADLVQAGYWFTDTEIAIAQRLAPSATLQRAFTFSEIRSNPFQTVTSPLASLSTAWGLFLETLFLGRCMAAITEGKSSSEGAWLKSQSTCWALKVVEAMIDNSVRILGFGSGRVHVAVPASDPGVISEVAAVALSNKAFVYGQDGSVHVPDNFESNGVKNVYVGLLMGKESGKLAFADNEIQKVLRNTTISGRMDP